MTGTLVNAAGIVAGSVAGLVLRRRAAARGTATAMQAVGLATLFIGLEMAWQPLSAGQPARVPLVPVLLALALGGYLGEVWHLEEGLEGLGDRLRRGVERRLGAQDGDFSRAFVASSLLFVVGPMAVIGSLNDGMTGDCRILLAKSLMDGVASVAFASTMGPGVILSAATVLVYQGVWTLAGVALGASLNPIVLATISAAGGLLIAGLGLNLLDAARVRTGNLLPALLLAPLVVWVWQALGLP